MATAVESPAEKLKEANPIGWGQLASATRCSRCGGLMVMEQCFDLLARRCVQCGEIVDPVILQNRNQRFVATQETDLIQRTGGPHETGDSNSLLNSPGNHRARNRRRPEPERPD